MDTILFFTFSTRYNCKDRIDGAIRYAQGRKWHVQTIERRAIKGTVEKIIDFWKPIGVIAECAGGFPEISAKETRGLPIVYLDENPDGSAKGKGTYVNSDAEAIGRLAARELLSAGFRQFAFVGYPGALFWSEARRRAFADALEMHGFRMATFNDGGQFGNALRRKRLARFLAALPKPCGLFAANDPTAEEALQLAAANGIAVPNELAVIGVDDDAVICDQTVPPLTSVRVDFERGGYFAAELLGERIDNPRTEWKAVKYPPVCVVHRMTVPRPRRLAAGDPRVVRAQDFIRREACSGLAVSDVVKVMGCSRRLAEIVFRESIGRTILREITSVRIERAQSLLRSPRVVVESVAQQCGWSSVSAFREAFRREVGRTVTEWRNMREEG